VDICRGDEIMPWETFIDALSLLVSRKEEIGHALSRRAVFSENEDPLDEQLILRAKCIIYATNTIFRKSNDREVQQKLLSLESLVTCLLVPFETTDPRDVIYSALNMAKDTRVAPEISAVGKSTVPLDHRITPNYGKGTADVYVDFVEYCMEKSKKMDILCRHWAPVDEFWLPDERGYQEIPSISLDEFRLPEQREDQGTPSIYLGENLLLEGREDQGTPSWIQSIKGHAFGGFWGGLKGRVNGDGMVDSIDSLNGQVYNASSGFTGIDFSISRDPAPPKQQILPRSQWLYSTSIPYTLTTKGYRIGRITKISTCMSQGVISREALELGGWEPRSAPEDAPNELWRTLVANRGPNGTPAPAWYRRAFVESLRHVDGHELDTNAVKNLEQTPKTITSFLNRVQQVVWNRRLFHAEIEFPSGIIGKPTSMTGLADNNATVDDDVYILPGCSVPVVLREGGKTTGGIYFYLVGECYLHGVMEGEAADDFRAMQPDEINLK
jgi:hypothetical protein